MNRLIHPAQQVRLIKAWSDHGADPQGTFDTEPGDVLVACYMVRNYNPGNSRIPGWRMVWYFDSSSDEYTGLWFKVARGRTERVFYDQAAAAAFGVMQLRPSLAIRGSMLDTKQGTAESSIAATRWAKRGVNVVFTVGALSAVDELASGGEGHGSWAQAMSNDYGDEVIFGMFSPNPEGEGNGFDAISIAGMSNNSYERRYSLSLA